MNCDCPPSAALGDIDAQDCPEDLGQVQRLFFQRLGAGSFATEIIFAAQATWTPLFIAADGTKITKSPRFENHIIPQVEPITEGGGDNTTLDGAEVVLGSGPVTVTGTFRSVKNAIIEQMKLLGCESTPGQSPGLGVFMVNEFGKLIGIQSGIAGTTVSPIPVTSFFVSDSGNDGKNTNDKSNFRYNLKEGWRNGLILVQPDFDALTV